MALTYDIGQDFLLTDQERNSGGYAETAPFWIVAVIRWKQVVTYDRRTRSGFPSTDVSQLVAEAGKGPLLITDDCLNLAVHTSKNSHVSNLAATLIGGEINYLTEILPGDWCLAWMLQSETQGQQVLEKLKKGQPANDFMDGLKFVGKITNVRKNLSVDGTGHKQTRYSVQANGFTEFDSSMFYDPLLQIQDPDLNSWLYRVGIATTSFLNEIDDKNPGIDINKAIPELVELLLGRGLPQTYTNPGEFPNSPVVGQTSTADAPYALVIPTSVARILGKATTDKQILGYSDIFEAMYGIQNYQNASLSSNPKVQQQNPALIFTPDGGNQDKPRRHLSNGSNAKDMLGSFLPTIPQFADTNLWTIFSQYLNPTVNEMYTTLRVNNKGKIVPMFIVRQLPFSTDVYASTPPITAKGGGDSTLSPNALYDDPISTIQTQLSNTTITPGTAVSNKENVTRFLELPRWSAPASLVYRFDVGRSNALRFNYVYLSGQDAEQKVDPVYITAALIQNPPLRDDGDIKRHGLRMARSNVACSPFDTFFGPAKWMEIKADILMGQHLTLTGTVEMQGVQAPICIGDNFEFDNTVYHIEAISHACVIAGGRKYFHTELSLSNGVSTAVDVNNPQTIYAGMDSTALRTYDPGLTIQTNNPVDSSVLRAPPTNKTKTSI